MYILLVNIHGLVRSHNIEFGRDADTGGQTRYIVDLARELGSTPGVARVDLITRLIRDKTVSVDYSAPEESLGGRARIVRLPAGGSKYIRKERLWPFLDEFTDRLVSFLRQQERLPDVVHGHYADSGYVAEQVAELFGLPFVFTAHSLGRNKLSFLMSQGWTERKADERFAVETRIRCEEKILSRADFIVASTSYERDSLYGMYENSELPRFEILPPGLDLESFFPYYDYKLPGDSIPEEQKQAHVRMLDELRRFHFEPDKPLILTLCRPDARKNIDRLIQVYGEDKELQAMANLAIFAGLRDDIADMEDGERQVLTDILLAMDKYDLYGKMAVPKNHDPMREVPELYRIAALSGGVFISASYLETFGLTFIEASASGLPFIATDKGGPVDIARNLESGRLVDIDNRTEVTGTIKRIISDGAEWTALSENGINYTRRIYSWKNHAASYLKALEALPTPAGGRAVPGESRPAGLLLRQVEWLVIVDIDGTLIGDDDATARLYDWLRSHRDHVGFGIATGRSLESAKELLLREKGLPEPDVWILSVGTEIYYGSDLVEDKGWKAHLSRKWAPDRIRSVLDARGDLELQDDPGSQRPYKISYDIVGADGGKRDASGGNGELLPALHTALSAERLWYNLVHSHGSFVDVLPYRASKGKAVRYLSNKWSLPLSRFITAGNSGNDRDMLTGSIRGIVVGNHEDELEGLRKTPNIYFAEGTFADGILEGLGHYVGPAERP